MKNVNLDRKVDFVRETKENLEPLNRDICVEVKWSMNEYKSLVCSSIFYPLGEVEPHIERGKLLGDEGRNPNPNPLGPESLFSLTSVVAPKDIGIANKKVTNDVVSMCPTIWYKKNSILVTAKPSLR